MELLSKQEVSNLTEVTYVLRDDVGVLYYKEYINDSGKVVDTELRDKDGNSIDDPSLFEDIQTFIDKIDS